MSASIAFIADSLDNAYKFQQALARFDGEVSAGSTAQLKKLLAPGTSYDLIVFEARGAAQAELEQVRVFAEESSCPLLVIVDAQDCATLAVPSPTAGDFIVNGASLEECTARVGRLLFKKDPEKTGDMITVDNMVINLATYQVTVGGEPIDFTYLEYALLSFLVRHPGHTFSRDALLQHVWGFDYYGGSRTVDVHVRRIRAKLGPELAQRLETIRGVGYLWSV